MPQQPQKTYKLQLHSSTDKEKLKYADCEFVFNPKDIPNLTAGDILEIYQRDGDYR